MTGATMAGAVAEPVLAIDGLRVEVPGAGRRVPVVDGVGFSIARGEVLALVGESGCGKTMTALSVPRLLPRNVTIAAGTIHLAGERVDTASQKVLEGIRGRRIGMIFQEPMTSLNPVLTIGRQLTEGPMKHLGLSHRDATARALEMLELVRIADGRRRLGDYPHQLSGGMRQRVMIAIALACDPALVIADEPTTALDVTIQAQILDLLDDLRCRLGTSILLITHDLGVVAEIADRIVVMYAGRVVEEGPVARLLAAPRHPYTRGLMAARPSLEAALAADGPPPPLPVMPGVVPAGAAALPGCAFADRCPHVMPRCRAERPPLLANEAGHAAACWASTP